MSVTIGRPTRCEMRTAPNLFGVLPASGISFLTALQAFFNIAMSIGLALPIPHIFHWTFGRIPRRWRTKMPKMECPAITVTGWS